MPELDERFTPPARIYVGLEGRGTVGSVLDAYLESRIIEQLEWAS